MQIVFYEMASVNNYYLQNTLLPEIPFREIQNYYVRRQGFKVIPQVIVPDWGEFRY